MSRDEAIKVLDLYRDWNEGQVSVSLAFKGIRTPEDDGLDGRRKLIAQAMNVLAESRTIEER